ncbi:LysR family transcriptional regulator [Vibrio sp. SCSIO 43140]|uniref:LysR family transcriptional regulator n=1 Tax=Vibrio sp. SCSIO 43140 TaxID=2819100 RepID=UPI002075EDEA|nr:LysR family transcriptional regulator [Vibrio sp. SCSIO 43140]USD62685.1 LysR family transcriptional regulator [Vibrio sp. SCSIO 43140]
MALNKSIKYFLAVAKHGNIKRASDELYISQPSLTAAIKKLESEMGAPLFNRLSKGVELTAYGLKFREFAQEQQEHYFALKHQFNDMQQRQFGKVKIGTGEVWWEGFVKRSVMDYQAMHPASSFHLEFGNNLSLLHHLIQGDIDLFIGHEVSDLSESCRVAFQPLFQDFEALYVSNRHPLATGISDHSVISNYPLLRVTPSHPRHQSVLLNGLPHDELLDERIIYDVDSVMASIDMLHMTQAVMPYSHRAQAWLKKHNIVAAYLDSEKIGNIGIYTKQGEAKRNVDELVELLKSNADIAYTNVKSL